MKEVTKDFQENEVEIVAEQQQKKEIKLIGQQRKIPGHTLFEYNEVTKELIPAKFRPASVMISYSSMEGSQTTTTHTVIINEHCLYVQALNKKNAFKKLTKSGISTPSLERR